jgi:hypothetical protein
MNNEEEDPRMAGNLAAIRTYLKVHFDEFHITEESYGPSYHKFTVAKFRPPTSYKLQVTWPKISDSSNTSAKIKRLLVKDDVAAGMRAERGDYFSWGWHA